MKKNLLVVILFLCSLCMYSQQDINTYKALYMYMFDNGYMPCDMHRFGTVWRNAGAEILGESFQDQDGNSVLYLDLTDGLQYNFYYTNSVKDIPNIMVTVVVDGHFFYKINKNLEGEIYTMIDADTGEEVKWLIFY